MWVALRENPELPLDDSRIEAVAAATRRAGIWNVPTQVLTEGRLRSDEKKDSISPDAVMRRRIVDIRRRLIKALSDAGAGLLLGTDAPLVPLGASVHTELELLVAAGLTPYQALATGTRNVAEFFGTVDSTGTIAVGKRADLILLRGNPLKDIRNTASPSGVMLGGRWLDRAALDARLELLGRTVKKATR